MYCKLLILLCLSSYTLFAFGRDSINNIIETQSQKFKSILETIEGNYYKDSIDFIGISESAFSSLLKELDPFSVYFSSEQYKNLKETFMGSNCGTGIRLFRRSDSILVFTVQKGSSADSAGILVGDRVIYINHEYVVGKEISFANKKLNLKSNDFNIITIKRANALYEFKLPCKELDIPSVVTKLYIAKDKTAFIRFVRFGKNTYSEFISALDSLINLGADFLVVDIRGNQGGYLEIANKITSLFLNKGDTVVIINSRNEGKKVYTCDENGKYSKLPMAVLIDRSTASAAEIFASALQENNRALIVGERSFGKGLVQRTWEFKDGSAFRLTTAEYFTPIGRSLQKNQIFSEIDTNFIEESQMDSIARKNLSEIIKQYGGTNRLPTYFTKTGKLILGGGGIFPDVFFRTDTLPPYLQKLKNNGFINDFILRYFIDDKKIFSNLNTLDINSFIYNFNISEGDLLEFKKYTNEWKSLDVSKFEIERNSIEMELKATLGYVLWGVLGYYTTHFYADKSLITKLGDWKLIAKNFVN